MDNLSFIRSKFANHTILRLIKVEWQGVWWGILKNIPGVLLGGGVRAIYAKLFFGHIKGVCLIQPGVTLVEVDRMYVGKRFTVNTGTYINAKGKIYIGDDVLIGDNVTISSGKHIIEGRNSTILSRPTKEHAIIIDSDVWIGAGAVLMPGIHVRKGTVIGANSVVTHDTEPYSVVYGSPARARGCR